MPIPTEELQDITIVQSIIRNMIDRAVSESIPVPLPEPGLEPIPEEVEDGEQSDEEIEDEMILEMFQHGDVALIRDYYGSLYIKDALTNRLQFWGMVDEAGNVWEDEKKKTPEGDYTEGEKKKTKKVSKPPRDAPPPTQSVADQVAATDLYAVEDTTDAVYYHDRDLFKSSFTVRHKTGEKTCQQMIDWCRTNGHTVFSMCHNRGGKAFYVRDKKYKQTQVDAIISSDKFKSKQKGKVSTVVVKNVQG